MTMKETPEEFLARMDRARKDSARGDNWATAIGISIYGLCIYFYFANSINIVYAILIALETVLLVVSIRLLRGIARSRRA